MIKIDRIDFNIDAITVLAKISGQIYSGTIYIDLDKSKIWVSTVHEKLESEVMRYQSDLVLLYREYKENYLVLRSNLEKDVLGVLDKSRTVQGSTRGE